VYEQIIHKNYVDDNLNKGFSEEISNIQIIRNDFDNSTISVLYFNNRMLFIRHFQTGLLIPNYDSNGNLNNKSVIRHLELTGRDDSADPPKERSVNVPIFLVGIIPDSIKNTFINDIENEIPYSESNLFIYFPYKDPDTPSDIEANKAMVNLFNENFEVDTNTQPFGINTKEGLMRIFYKDNFDNINGVIIDGTGTFDLEVMSVFKGVKN
jgi:hypothetical protein